jgi:hypothetical protein
LNGGVSIIRKKKFYWVHSGRYKWFLGKPELITGRKVLSHGIGYIIIGFILIIVSITLFVASL